MVNIPASITKTIDTSIDTMQDMSGKAQEVLADTTQNAVVAVQAVIEKAQPKSRSDKKDKKKDKKKKKK